MNSNVSVKNRLGGALLMLCTALVLLAGFGLGLPLQAKAAPEDGAIPSSGFDSLEKSGTGWAWDGNGVLTINAPLAGGFSLDGEPTDPSITAFTVKIADGLNLNGSGVGFGGTTDYTKTSIEVGSGVEECTFSLSNTLGGAGTGITVPENSKIILLGYFSNARICSALYGAGDITIRALTLASPLDNFTGTIGTTNPITIDTSAGDTVFRGHLRQYYTITKTGSGTLTLDVAGVGNGGALWVVDQGTLKLTSVAPIKEDGVTNNSTLEFALASNEISTKNITGTGAVVKNGTGTLTLTGANTYDGVTTINSGTLQVGNGAATGSIKGAITINQNGTLAYNRSDLHRPEGSITGSGTLRQSGSGTLRLPSGFYSFGGTLDAAAGTTEVYGTELTLPGTLTGAGTVKLTSALFLNSTFSGFTGTIETSNGAGLMLNPPTNQAFNGTATGNGGIGKSGPATVTLAGQNTYSGSTTLQEGTLVAAHPGALGTGTLDMYDGGHLQVAAGVQLQVEGIYQIGGKGTYTFGAGSSITATTGNIYLPAGTNLVLNGFAPGTHTLFAVQSYGGGARVLGGSPVDVSTFNVTADGAALAAPSTIQAQLPNGTEVLPPDETAQRVVVTLVAPPTPGSGSPQTGDAGNLPLWAGLGTLALAGLVVLAIALHRKRQKAK